MRMSIIEHNDCRGGSSVKTRLSTLTHINIDYRQQNTFHENNKQTLIMESTELDLKKSCRLCLSDKLTEKLNDELLHQVLTLTTIKVSNFFLLCKYF